MVWNLLQKTSIKCIYIYISQIFQVKNLPSVTVSLGDDLNHRCYRQLSDTYREKGLFSKNCLKNKFDTVLAVRYSLPILGFYSR